VTSINKKLGLKPAGKRPMMKGTGKDAVARKLTSMICPKCPHRWLLVSVTRGIETALCAWCGWSGPRAECYP
jgi:hypothetical protein